MTDRITTAPSITAQRALARLGARLRLARVHRKLRQTDLAERIGRSRATVAQMEKGSGKVEIGAYVNTLSALGLLDELELVADPGLDRDAQALVFSVAEKRVRPKKPLDNDF